jgi:hypothetical protein
MSSIFKMEIAPVHVSVSQATTIDKDIYRKLLAAFSPRYFGFIYSLDQVQAEEMRRTNPEFYERQRGEGYLRGVVGNRPAVISVNMFYAALAVNDFLARLHSHPVCNRTLMTISSNILAARRT